MNNPLLQTLLNDPTGGQIAAGIMMILVFSSVGLIAAAATAYIARRVFLGWYGRIYWAGMLIAIAALYMGFAAWFQASPEAWTTELIGIAVFVTVAAVGAFSAPSLALGYLMHGLWDVAHSLYGTTILGHVASDIPLGYDMFCLGYDLTAAAYLAWYPKAWDQPARFNPAFWRNPD